MALALWCFEPNVLGNAAQITADAPAASAGVLAGYMFWRWLRRPRWPAAILAGLLLGVAELTKTTWIVLLPLWPALWLVWRIAARGSRRVTKSQRKRRIGLSTSEIRNPKLPSLLQLAVILATALYLINLGYAFEDSFQRLDSFKFISRALGGPDAHAVLGNRFVGTTFGVMPVPAPAN
jgi:hypothetical protein